MYINTFKYTPKDVSCQLCTEYVKKLGCTALRCPWLAERIEAGVVGYPISRAESRESFAQLMERYPQPEQAPTYTEETVAVYGSFPCPLFGV